VTLVKSKCDVESLKYAMKIII